MKLSVILFILASFFLYPALAVVQSETHTYILSKKECKLLVIDRKTGKEKVIELNSTYSQHIALHDGFGYIPCYQDHKMYVIDLIHHDIDSLIPYNHGAWPKYITFYKGYGYLCLTGADMVAVFDPKTCTIIKEIPVNLSPNSITVYGKYGYVLCYDSPYVDVIDLDEGLRIKSIEAGNASTSIILHQGFGYVCHQRPKTVSLIDLRTNAVTETIQLEDDPSEIRIWGNYAFIRYDHRSMITVLDLNSRKIIKCLPFLKPIQNFALQNDVLYVASSDTVYAVDLHTFKFFYTIDNVKELDVNVSDTHLYLGVHKVGPLVHFFNRARFNVLKAENKVLNYAKAFPFFTERKKEIVHQDTHYADLLSQAEISALLCALSPQEAVYHFLALYQPKIFLKGADNDLKDHLYVGFFNALTAKEDEIVSRLMVCFLAINDPLMKELAAL